MQDHQLEPGNISDKWGAVRLEGKHCRIFPERHVAGAPSLDSWDLPVSSVHSWPLS